MKDYLLIIITAILSALGVILIKIYIKHKSKYLFLMASICSIIVLYLYSILLKKNDLGKIYTIIKISAILLVVMTGCMIFKEKITTKNKIGIALAIVAIVLLGK